MPNVRIHSPEVGSCHAGDAEQRAVLHGDGVGLLCIPALDGPPLEEAVRRHDAAALRDARRPNLRG